MIKIACRWLRQAQPTVAELVEANNPLPEQVPELVEGSTILSITFIKEYLYHEW